MISVFAPWHRLLKRYHARKAIERRYEQLAERTPRTVFAVHARDLSELDPWDMPPARVLLFRKPNS